MLNTDNYNGELSVRSYNESSDRELSFQPDAEVGNCN